MIDQARPADLIFMKPSDSSCNGLAADATGTRGRAGPPIAAVAQASASSARLVPKIAEKSPKPQLVPMLL